MNQWKRIVIYLQKTMRSFEDIWRLFPNNLKAGLRNIKNSLLLIENSLAFGKSIAQLYSFGYNHAVI